MPYAVIWRQVADRHEIARELYPSLAVARREAELFTLSVLSAVEITVYGEERQELYVLMRNNVLNQNHEAAPVDALTIRSNQRAPVELPKL